MLTTKHRVISLVIAFVLGVVLTAITCWVTYQGDQQIEIKALPYGEQAKITGNATLNEYGYFSGEIYNGSSWTITQIVFRVVAKEKDGTVRWNRKFETGIFNHSQNSPFRPLSTGTFEIMTTQYGGGISGLEWGIEEIRGRPG